MHLSVFIATSLDGFIAREDGSIDWLPDIDTAGGEDYGYRAFMKDIDVIVMGRNSYDKVLQLGEWFYGKTPVVVLTSRPWEPPVNLSSPIEAMSGEPTEVLAKLAQRGWERVYIDGGRTIQSFLRTGLVQRPIITRVPVLIGTGIPLFGPLDRDIRLRHVSTKAFPLGLVQSEYEVVWSVLDTLLP